MKIINQKLSNLKKSYKKNKAKTILKLVLLFFFASFIFVGLYFSPHEDQKSFEGNQQQNLPQIPKTKVFFKD
jgi:hypothetical protein